MPCGIGKAFITGAFCLAGALLGMHSRLKADPAPQFNTDIVLLGDSITHQWGGTRSHEDLGIYVGQTTTDPITGQVIKGDFRTAWETAFPNYRGINMGVSGDRVEHVLWRLDHGTLDGIRPKVVVLLIGTNNTGLITGYGVPVNSIPQGIKLCVDNIRSKLPQTHVVVVKILPANIPSSTIYQNTRLINQGIDALNLEAPGNGVRVLDMWNDFLDPADPNPDKVVNATLFLSDKLHLTEAGYQKYASKLQPLITPFLDGSAPLPTIAPAIPVYPYAPYNNKLLDKQLTGWPLTPDEARYILKVEYNDRKPGAEPGGGGMSTKTAFWATTPTARFWRDLKDAYNPAVEVLHRNILREAGIATGQTVEASIPVITNPVSRADEKVFITSNQKLSAPQTVVSPNGTYTLSVRTDGYLEITSGATSVWKSTIGSPGSISVNNVSLHLTAAGNLVFNTAYSGGTYGMWASGTYQGGGEDNYYCALTNAGQLKTYKGVSPNGTLMSTFPAPASTAATVTLSGLAQTGDGSPKVVTVTTNPAGINHFVTYNGSTTPPLALGTYAVVATIANLNHTGTATGNLVISPANTYGTWQSGIQWDGKDGGANADPNHNGLSNLMEYAMDLDPVGISGTEKLPTVHMDSTIPGGPWLTYTFRWNKNAGDLTRSYLNSPNLREWPPLTVDGSTVIEELADPNPDGDGSAELRRLRVKVGTIPARFLRLRIVN
jgi:lysophospholipase L1-like esterase